MALKRLTLREHIERFQTSFEDRVSGINPFLPIAALRKIAGTLGGAMHLLYGYVDAVVARFLPFSSESIVLKKWTGMHDINENASTPAQLTAGVTGDEGETLPATKVFQTEEGFEYTVDADVIIAGGVGTAQLTAVEKGVAGNIPVGTVLTLVSPEAGIDDEATITQIVEFGFDTETPEQLYERWRSFIAETSTGGNDNDYKRWAREISGVDAVDVFPRIFGLGSVGVMFTVVGENENILPTEAKRVEVFNNIAAKAPIDSDILLVFLPSLNAMNPIISVTPDTAEVREAIRVELTSLIKREGGANTSIPVSQIDEAISISPGEFSHTLHSPTSPFTTGPTQASILGTIGWL